MTKKTKIEQYKDRFDSPIATANWTPPKKKATTSTLTKKVAKKRGR